jgi:hypothetical protein
LANLAIFPGKNFKKAPIKLIDPSRAVRGNQ